MYFGHYRNTKTAAAGVPQTVIGFRQYDQAKNAAYHMLAPLPEKAKRPFTLTTTFQDFYMPMGFKNGSTMVKADETGVVDLSSEFSGKQDTLVSGTNIKTINNESILGSGNITIEGGGGKAVSGGTNISITTGETADTINCTLPIVKVQGYQSVIIGDSRNTVRGDGNVAVGRQNNINAKDGSYVPDDCFVGGENNNVYNSTETAFGKYNNSVQNTLVGGASGTTLFSVGNGTADNARHNAFEIRQNGDIYITSGGTDIKLQDNLGGGSSINVVQTTGTSTGDVMSQDAVTTALSGKADAADLGGLKLQQITQSSYDSLTTKDASTLYVIVG